MQKRRIEWIDYAKGITILMVIVGHCSIPGIARGAIFSFHMPLFFLLSMMTFRLSETSDQLVRKTEKAFCHLIIPMIWVTIARVIIEVFYHPAIFESLHSVRHFVQDRILMFCFASGVNVSIDDSVVHALGIPWFFAVLFVGRTLFDYLHFRLSLRNLVIVVMLLSITGVVIGKFQRLPFSLDIAFAILPLFLVAKFIGHQIKEASPFQQFLKAAVLWGITYCAILKFCHSHLELVCRSYPAFPLCLLTAIFGTVMIGNFSVIVSRFRSLAWVKTIGQYSLWLLCIHCFDYSVLHRFWMVSSRWYIHCVMRLAVDLIVFAIIFLLYKRFANKRQN